MLCRYIHPTIVSPQRITTLTFFLNQFYGTINILRPPVAATQPCARVQSQKARLPRPLEQPDTIAVFLRKMRVSRPLSFFCIIFAPDFEIHSNGRLPPEALRSNSNRRQVELKSNSSRTLNNLLTNFYPPLRHRGLTAYS